MKNLKAASIIGSFVACAVWTACAATDGKELLQRAKDAQKSGAYAEGATLADNALDKLRVASHKYDALRTGFECRYRLHGEGAWEWLEKRAKKAESSNPALANEMMGVYGYEAYKFFRDDLVRRALAWFEKRGTAPYFYSQHWVRVARMFDDLKAFPRAETEIVFPAAPAWFGTAKGKTVRVKDAAAFNPDDMTAAIQKVIDDPAVGTIVFDKMAAPWRVSSLKPRSNQTFVFESGVRFLADAESQKKPSADLFLVRGVSNVVFVGRGQTSADVRLGMYADYEERKKLCRTYGGSGFSLDGAKNVAIVNMTVADCACDGLSVSGLRPANNGIYVKDVVFESNYRQACSLVNVDGIYFKNVAFNDTRGNSPMCGIDIEPSIQEVQAAAEIYLFDCSFKGNVGSHLNWSCSSAYPVTFHAKRCDFAPNAAGCIEIFALPGLYFRADVAAPSKIIFEDCHVKQFRDKKAINFQNSSFFNVAFVNTTVEDVEPLRAGREPEGAPVAFNLQRTYAQNNCDKPGKVVFKNLKVKGWKERPPIAFYDRSGTYSVTNLHGTIVHNGKKVKASAFRHLSQEKSLDFFPAFDPAAYAPLEKAPKTTETSVPLRIKLTSGGPWYEPKPKYQAIYWDGKAWQTRDAAPDMKNLADLAGKPVAFVGKPVMSWGNDPVDYSPAYQITPGKDFKGDTIYFEVPAGAQECVIRLLGDAEIRSASGRLVGAYESVKDSRAGVKYIRFKPASKKSEVYSVRIPRFAFVKFFHPLTGVIAEKPEWLPRLKDVKASGKSNRR